MKKMCSRVTLSALTAMLIVASASPVSDASTIIPTVTKLKIKYFGYPGSNGEFGVFLDSNGSYANVSGASISAADFRTFCAEKFQSFDLSDEMTVTALSKTTNDTGPYALTKQAAWLFRKFSQLSTSGYVGSLFGTAASQYYDGSTAHADLFQDAIWYFIGGQIAYPGAGNNIFVDYVNANASDWSGMDDSGSVSIAGVSILNLVDQNGNKVQDQLYYDASSDTFIDPVPEPMSAALWLFALAGGTMVRRRQRQR